MNVFTEYFNQQFMAESIKALRDISFDEPDCSLPLLLDLS